MTDLIIRQERKYPNSISRGRWQDYFCEFLDECGFDGTYGHISDESLKKHLVLIDGDEKGWTGDMEKAEAFDNGVFRVLPYWWGNSDNIAGMSNFIFYPTGFEMIWYKYPLRDAWSNKPITYQEFKDMINKCRESLKNG